MVTWPSCFGPLGKYVSVCLSSLVVAGECQEACVPVSPLGAPHPLLRIFFLSVTPTENLNTSYRMVTKSLVYRF